jgi:hypothetical protein
LPALLIGSEPDMVMVRERGINWCWEGVAAGGDVMLAGEFNSTRCLMVERDFRERRPAKCSDTLQPYG